MVRIRESLLLVIVPCSTAALVLGQAPVSPSAPGGNLVLNGDFEIHSGGPCDTDLSNASFTSQMSDATGFGTAEEIDVYSGGSCDQSGVGSGVRKVCIRRRPDGQSDAFSLTLAAPIQAGNSYTLRFLARAPYLGVLGHVQVGVSDSATSFGTLVYTGVLPDSYSWIQFTWTFVAPVDATFLTVSEDRIDAWSHVDAFTLTSPGLGAKYCLTRLDAGGPSDIFASGSASASAGDLLLTSSPVPNMPGVFFHGMSQTVVPFGYGYLCTSGNIARSPVKVATGNVATYAYDNSDAQHSLAAFVGNTRHFQYWFRDCGFVGSCSYNLSTAISIAILP